MAYVGMIANPLPDRERVFEGLPKPGQAMQARYTSGLYPLAEMGPLLRRQGAQVGLDRAEVWVAITDGGAGLEDFVRLNFPRVEAVILDFYHAAEYLAKLAQALLPTDEVAAAAQTKSWSRLLRDEGGDAMIAVLENWEWPSVKGLAAVRADVLRATSATTWIGWTTPITRPRAGTSVRARVESACKTVVGQRLKGSGMRWSEAGAHAVCHVRALYRSEHSQWTDFWRRSTAA